MANGQIRRKGLVVAEGADQVLERSARFSLGQQILGDPAQPPPENLRTRETRSLGHLLQEGAIGPVEVDLNRLTGFEWAFGHYM